LINPVSSNAPDPTTDDALTSALRQLLGPLARLAVARGVTHAALDELLKLALVDAADRSHADLPPHRRVSRITTATGIHRREVTRLVQAVREGGGLQAPPSRSHANELFAHWRTDPAYCDRRGAPAEIPRQGPAPSFESLAHGITRDVHPRSLLDELVRLGLAAWDNQRDTVRLVRGGFVPQGDQARMMSTLGRNVGSHLAAAVDNVLFDDRRHFEQALFAQGLSDSSMGELRGLVRDQWQALLQALVPALESMVARDEADAINPSNLGNPAAQRHRIRLGLYNHEQVQEPPAAPPTASEPKP
jgi:hypothetical protein